MKRIVSIKSRTAMVSRSHVVVGAVVFELTLDCAHVVERGPYPHGRKFKRPVVGAMAKCDQCGGA